MQILMVLYLIVMCSIIPLYMKKGYYELGEAKAICYIAVSLCFFALFLLAIWCGSKKKMDAAKKWDTDLTPTELCLYATMLSGLVSFIFSVDKKTAFLGFEGWRNGFLMLLLMTFFGIAYSRFEKMPRWSVALCMLVPAYEFLLGILNRFGIYTNSYGGESTGYLANIGNINWYSGFLSVFVPLGIGIMYAQRPFSKLFFLSGIYEVLGITALFLQGSDGALLIVLAGYLLLLLVSLSGDDRHLLKKCLIQFFVLGVGMTVADILLALFGRFYTYDDNLLTSLARMHIGIILMAAALFLYRLIRLFEEIHVSYKPRVLRSVLMGMTVILLVAGAYSLVMRFDDEFGNGRGIIWRLCTDAFLDFSSWRMMVGVGQDCLYSYALSDPGTGSAILNAFGGDMLTNAHCELLTVLIERGLIGAVSYLALFSSIIFELFRAKEKENAAIICALPVFSYLVYSQISFSQAVSTPFVFILMGFFVAFKRKTSDNIQLRQVGDGN